MKHVYLYILLGLLTFMRPSIALNIYVDGIIENNKLIPCVYINDTLVITVSNKGVKQDYQSNFERSQSIVERLKHLSNQGINLKRMYIRFSENYYSAYIKKTRIFTVSKKDQTYFKQHAYTIAKTWRQNIKDALPESNNTSQNDAFVTKTVFHSNPSSTPQKWSLEFRFLALSFVMILSLLMIVIFFIIHVSKQKIHALKSKLVTLEKNNPSKRPLF